MRLMSVNGQPDPASADRSKLDWNGRVLSAEDVRSRLNGRPEIVLRPDTIITPSASDELKRNGIRIVRRRPDVDRPKAGGWAYAQDRNYPLVSSVAQVVKREGLDLEPVQIVSPVDNQVLACRWARALAETVQDGRYRGVLAFCEAAGMVCCVANKVRGVRAIVAGGMTPHSKVTAALAANFIGIDVLGRTFFELKQLVRLICGTAQPACSGELAEVIGELESHAHR
jgi:hypothetical protein